jgi:hypothetical protein
MSCRGAASCRGGDARRGRKEREDGKDVGYFLDFEFEIL